MSSRTAVESKSNLSCNHRPRRSEASREDYKGLDVSTRDQQCLASCAACSVAATICPRPLQVVTWTATQSLHLGCHRACQWCGSSYYIRIPSLKFIGHPIPKTWRIFGHVFSRHGDLDIWPFHLSMGSRVTRVMGFLPANFQLPTPFHPRLIESDTRQTDDGHHCIVPPPDAAGTYQSLKRKLTSTSWWYTQRIMRPCDADADESRTLSPRIKAPPLFLQKT